MDEQTIRDLSETFDQIEKWVKMKPGTDPWWVPEMRELKEKLENEKHRIGNRGL